MSERYIFEKMIKDDPYDFVTRKVFADWLDEHDETELANKHRNWTIEKQEAWEWLENCATKCSGTRYYFKEEELMPNENPISIEELIHAAHKYLDSGECLYLPMNTEGIRSDDDEFWANFSLVTGREVGPEVERREFIRCAC